MNEYEQRALAELVTWKKKMTKKSGKFERMSKKAQTKVNGFIPDRVHKMIADSIKSMIEAVLSGSKYMSKEKNVMLLSLQQKEEWITETVAAHRKTAIIEGVGTGAAGLLIGLADFPLLLSIKMKLLFEISRLYGFDPNKYEERLFILHIFQMAFSSEQKRLEILHVIEEWGLGDVPEINWQELQQEYRDHIDVIKMFQLVPGLGAAVGAYANHHLLEQLGETAVNCYRIRLLKD
ncbi:ABC transporter-associated protein EcsC [Peribacillus simplex]|uniref:ABC transporter-associated protein EcsC n=1 Tax=Peribacillus simplex TaxID=1478 RepID=A0A109MWF7_9BACI|nr:EcsC family protein [Peribacillus simplex]KWW16927.1 ABC transporter-associated protein EcsC [Peribacillus simplex]